MLIHITTDYADSKFPFYIVKVRFQFFCVATRKRRKKTLVTHNNNREITNLWSYQQHVTNKQRILYSTRCRSLQMFVLLLFSYAKLYPWKITISR